MEAFEDPKHRGNGTSYHTGKSCIEPDCSRPAGTAWSPYWCFEHNVERIKRIDGQLNEIVEAKRRGEGELPRNSL